MDPGLSIHLCQHQKMEATRYYVPPDDWTQFQAPFFFLQRDWIRIWSSILIQMSICRKFRKHVELHHEYTMSTKQTGKTTGQMAQVLHHINLKKKMAWRGDNCWLGFSLHNNIPFLCYQIWLKVWIKNPRLAIILKALLHCPLLFHVTIEKSKAILIPIYLLLSLLTSSLKPF